MDGKGYNVRCVDATTDAYLGELFDVVVLGDIIEHVNNPVNLLLFAKRHLNDKGIILISTPNPYYINTILKYLNNEYPYINMDHIFWVTPFNMNELCCRVELTFLNYYLIIPKKNLFFKFIEILFSEELLGYNYIYRLSR